MPALMLGKATRHRGLENVDSEGDETPTTVKQRARKHTQEAEVKWEQIACGLSLSLRNAMERFGKDEH